jgi:Xaa-Pro aminopeptidase
MNPTPRDAHAARLSAVRRRLDALGLHALIVPSSDPHLSEYLPAHWQGREWLSGFTGSMGTLVVLPDKAALFADSRYWTQAQAQLQGSGITLEKLPSGASSMHVDWLAAQLRPGQAAAVDGRALSISAAEHWHAALRERGALLRTGLDVLGDVWPDRPALPLAPVFEHLPPHAGAARADKLAAVREAMARLQAGHHLVSTLDDIAWLLNLRGSDVPYNPVFLAHLLLASGDATLFIAPGKVPGALEKALAADGVVLAPYEEIGPALAALPASARICLDPGRCTIALRERLPPAVQVVACDNPSTLLKSRKTEAELAHWRHTMELDGAALCEFYAEFEALLAADPQGGGKATEVTVDAMLLQARARQAGFMGPSFATIAGFNANGAMPHYRATPQSHAAIDGPGLLLIDSGGQYLGGTTDITRVWAVGGEASEAQRRDYTLVLKGMMALSRATFPRGTPSPMLDAIARAPLWAQGLDYGHGTGHGVGYFLNVHEGPQSISRNPATASMAMQPSMVTSVEPGVYRPGQWGVRIENLVAAVPAPQASGAGFGDFLAFETLTLCPIDTRCIERGLLNVEEVDWLNRYHAEVRARLQGKVGGAALQWLLARTEAL